jgi:hypothetical protein
MTISIYQFNCQVIPFNIFSRINSRNLKESVIQNLIKEVSNKSNIIGESFNDSDAFMIKINKNLVDIT